jgi:SAM-dependent methyltransferase
MADSYDEIPYRSLPHPDTHPTHLAVIGRLLGIATPDPYRSRVLELGCAAGGNLLPLAYYLPDTECVGIERSMRQAGEGQRAIASLGLRNARIDAADILDVGPALGRFDYIVAHGVFSWVPDAVRRRILALCRELLAPGGLALVSFNTLPGWRLRGALRDMLLLECRGEPTPAARLERARGLLETLAAAGPVPGVPASQHVNAEVRYLLAAHPSYLFHEYLADTNEPLFFTDFVALAEAEGLQYVADAELATAFPSTLGSAAERALGAIDDQLVLEQRMDFVRVRSFRKALLCHAGADVRREIALADLADIAYYGDLRAPEPLSLADAEPAAFGTPGGGAAEICHPLAKAAAVILGERFPDSLAFADLAGLAAGRARDAGLAAPEADDRQALAAELFSLFAGGAVRAEPRARRVAPSAQGLPALGPLPAWQAARGHIPTPRHQGLELDPFATALASRLTGTATDAELAATMRELLATGAPRLASGGRMDPAGVDANVARLLALFRRHGVLGPPPSGRG